MPSNPFLMNFKQEVPCSNPEEGCLESEYSDELQMSVLPDGGLLWNARTKKMPTTCYTVGHRLKSGYTKSGKWKPSKYIPGKSDKRAGK